MLVNRKSEVESSDEKPALNEFSAMMEMAYEKNCLQIQFQFQFQFNFNFNLELFYMLRERNKLLKY